MKNILKNPFIKIVLVTALGTSLDAGLSVVKDRSKPLTAGRLGDAMAHGAIAGLFYGLRSPFTAAAGDGEGEQNGPKNP